MRVGGAVYGLGFQPVSQSPGRVTAGRGEGEVSAVPSIRSEPCRNCYVEMYLDMVGPPEERDWKWLHVPVPLRRTGAGEACERAEPRRRRGGRSVFRAGPGEL